MARVDYHWTRERPVKHHHGARGGEGQEGQVKSQLFLSVPSQVQLWMEIRGRPFYACSQIGI